MECFTHQGSSAVGICKACNKAVCRTCAKDMGFGIACSEACAKEATELQEMNAKGKKIYGIGAVQKKIPSGVLIYIIMSSVFCGIGVIGSLRGETQWAMLIFGAMFGLFGFIAYRRAKDIGLQC